MMGMYTWIAVGLVVGYIVAQQMARQRDMTGLVLLACGVSCVGAIVAGFSAMGLGYGSMEVFTYYGLAIAAVGSGAAMLLFGRVIGV